VPRLNFELLAVKGRLIDMLSDFSVRSLIPVLLLGLPLSAEDRVFPNRIRVDSDQKLMYQRRISRGFHLGTEIRYRIVGKVGRDEDLNSDQMAEYWLLTLTKELNPLGFRIDNTLRYFGDVRNHAQAGFGVAIGKEFIIKDNINFFPRIEAVTYSLNSIPEARGWHHQLEGLVGLTMGVEFLF
jgi:hypothetical protein